MSDKPWDRVERRKYPPTCYAPVNESLEQIKLTLARMEADVENRHTTNISTLSEIKGSMSKVTTVLYGNGNVGIVGKVSTLEDQRRSMVWWFRSLGGGMALLVIKEFFSWVSKISH